jgi:hypothetical protein
VKKRGGGALKPLPKPAETLNRKKHVKLKLLN